ncbi:hypothetical protein Pla123a_00500 [Posidoniimonas polymericola]|uniref:Uncharacterized protein n=1 Tax=Posidoniimonas polymericola TaxID=2528002 RepID=A0A5C5ZFB0_9BACT|nr:hypothetical protein [Posidoniimonas polymericola]TWT85243.1 hypothetical protein Pla123a_00500 [Posidoniimonas polymericola]
MRVTYAAIAMSCALLACWASPACAQRGGDAYSLRRYLGSDAYLAESFSRPSSPVSSQATVNEAARQALPQVAPPPATPSYTSGTSSTLNYYGGAAARQTLDQMPRRPRFIPQGGQPVGAGSKPYAGGAADPTISPYLNLFREEPEDSLPNYYTFVRPQQNQIETNRSQQRQLQGLQRQVQRTSYQAPANAGGGIPATGFRARFGDTGQFYSGWR